MNFMKEYMERKEYIKNIGFCRLNDVWVQQVAQLLKNKTCIEIMAGSGALSAALIKEGVNIISVSDNESWPDKWLNKKTPMEVLDAVEAIKKYGKEVDVIIMSWPPYETDIACKVVEAMSYNHLMLYIGETAGGCCATDEFFEMVEKQPMPYIDYETWSGLYDRVYLYKKK